MNQKKLSLKDGLNSQSTDKPRLIDANELIKTLCETFCGENPCSVPCETIDAIEKCPTAYDIDKITEMEDEIKELKAITGLMQKRTYYRKFVDEVWKKQEGKELSEPDFDYIYKLYFELIEARDKVIEQLKTIFFCSEDCSKNYYQGLGCKACLFGKAIKIMKGGGNHDD